ncbi:sulfotransferase [Granulosicoccaceae sp. 1_MG-2023]|nr:sulfotransferase [Granulosicoccaceae sp. 1_MG-2023]
MTISSPYAGAVPMWRLAFSALRRLPAFFFALRFTSLRGTLLLLAGLPVFLFLQAINWCGLLLDELLFPRWRETPVGAPLFVLGVPRSGTTFLHRVLADSGDFTTFRLWECMFAPSLTQRVFWRTLGRADRVLGAPLQRLLDWLQQRCFGSLDAIHRTRLDSAEEDYLALLPYLGSFILILPFPHAGAAWTLATADRDMPDSQRSELMAFYYALVQKHVYFHGSEKRFLSKNAAFAGLAGSLAATFPQARFLVCLREPEQALPSQLSAIRDGILLFHSPQLLPHYTARFLAVFPFFYANLHRAMQGPAASRHVFLSMHELQCGLDSCLPAALKRLQIPLSEPLLAGISQHAEASRGYRSSHKVRTDGLPELAAPQLRRHFARQVPALPYLMRLIKRPVHAEGEVQC